VAVDLDHQTVTLAQAGLVFAFAAPETLRQMLLQGVDEIDMTLARRAQIDAWRAHDRQRRPWAYTAPGPAPAVNPNT